MSIKDGPEGIDFQGRRGVSASDPKNDMDIVNLRTLRYQFSPANLTGSTIVSAITNSTIISAITTNENFITYINEFVTSSITANQLWKTGSTDTSLQPNRSDGNINLNFYSTIAGGDRNQLFSQGSFIGAGTGNIITPAINNYSSIIGGFYNTLNGIIGISSTYGQQFIGGGKNNKITGGYSSVIGGLNNTINGAKSFIGGGYYNNIDNEYSSIVGGQNNIVKGARSTIIGGYKNVVNSYESFIGSGSFNYVSSGSSFIIGGYHNSSNSTYSFIGNGVKNLISGTSFFSSIINGTGNTISNAKFSTIIGGNNYTLTASTTVLVPKLQIKNLPAGGTNMLLVDSSGRVFSGGIPSSGTSSSTSILNGLNTYTGGSASAYTVNVSALTIDHITVTAASVFNTITATTISGGTYYSGSTPLTTVITNLIPTGLTNYWKTGSTQTSLQPNRSDGNINSGQYSTIAGGSGNTASTQFSFIGGGSQNYNSGNYSSVIGGLTNYNYSDFASILGGKNNSISASSTYSSILGGSHNQLTGFFNVIIGGNFNAVYGSNNIVCGASGIKAYGNMGFVGNGVSNQLGNYTKYSSIINGSNNIITGSSIYSSIINGSGNTINNATGSTIIGGNNYTLTASTTVLVPKLQITNLPFGGTNMLLVDSSGSVFSGGTPGGGYTGLWKTGSTLTSLQPNRSDVNINSGDYSTIAGGSANTISGDYNFIGGGTFNTTTSKYSIIVGGTQNVISGVGSVVVSGGINKITGTTSAIVSGILNSVFGNNSFIGGGLLNTATTNYTSVVGGAFNIASAKYSFIGGGKMNKTFQKYSFVGGGQYNYIYGSSSFNSVIVGGAFNRIETGAFSSVIAGGEFNIISGPDSFIGAGHNNLISASTAKGFIGGGGANSGYSTYSFIGNGKTNSVIGSSPYSSIINGSNNTINNATGSTIIGGNNYTLTDSYTTLVPKLQIKNLPAGGTNMLLVDSSGRVFSGGIPSSGTSSSTSILNGLNTYTGGSASAYTVNVSALTIDHITVTAASVFNTITATTISGGTIYSGSTELSQIFSQTLDFRASAVTSSIFAGNPYQYTVVFTNNYPDLKYAVQVTGEDERSFVVWNKQMSGFTINSCSNTPLTGTTYWSTQKYKL